jgi:N-acetylglucosaminyldiphosphoundecaprenol N-acetyl-beta-D-mannosaminyltransferase
MAVMLATSAGRRSWLPVEAEGDHTDPVSAKRLRIGKLYVDRLDFDESLDAIEALVDAEKGGSVFTPNVDHVVTVEHHAGFASAYERCSLSLPDGMPIVWASKLLGLPLKERVAGADLILPLMERAARKKWRVFLLGAGPGVADKAAEVFRHRFGTNIVGIDAPMVRLDDASFIDGLVAQLTAAKPHLVLMAFGAPKQELLIDQLTERIRPCVSLGIGAGLDFVAGTVKRAPSVLQRAGLEWAYRLSQEPGRLWRRYLVNDPLFVKIVLSTLRSGQ